MLIRCYSDLHGLLPRVEPCDVLLVAGDVCPLDGERDFARMKDWIEGEFSDWLRAVPADRIVMTPGNHDFAIERQREWPDLPAELLIDQSTSIGELTLHASPWVPTLKHWAFYGDDDKLEAVAAAIPDGADIWLQHGPPYGYLDRLWRDSRHVGNSHTLKALASRGPQVFVCGHIHEAYGLAQHDGTLIANVSFVDEFYEPQHRHLALRADGETLRHDPGAQVNASTLWTL
ncbi:MAG: metallophosphoesterase [Thermoleophilaceae bacterium]|nr:metallophosphoesterase [Thermoleophilaceae bacterium]